MGFYDLNEVKSLSILDVCDMLGIPVKSIGGSHWCKLRNERTESCKLYVDTDEGYDSFCDFGNGKKGGNVINFTSEYLGCDWQEALETLAEYFHIPPINNTQYMTRSELTDPEYRKIGVYGDLATKNFDFDLEKYSLESAQKFSEMYAMSVNQLRKEYPNKYEFDIMRKRAIPFVYSLRNQYYFKIYCILSVQKSLTGHFDINNVSKEDMEECKKLCKQLTQAELLLKKALQGTDIVYSFRKYNVLSDLRDIYLGKVSFEIGEKTYSDLKRESKKYGVDLRYRSVSIDEYLSLKEYGIDSVPHGAFLKKDIVNLVFLPEQGELIDKCVDLHKKCRSLDAQTLDAASNVPNHKSSFEHSFDER